jgi:hypothetical protein
MPPARALVAVLGWTLALCHVAACDVTGVLEGTTNDDPSSEDDPCGNASGASPAPSCSEGACSCCGSCDPSRELCFTDDWSSSLGYGHCYGAPAGGTMTATVDGDAFVAAEVAAIASGAYLQVTGRIATTSAELRQISLFLPATLGAADCVSTSLAGGSYAHGEASEAWNMPRLDPRPPCSVTLTAIGEVGERIEGTFSMTLLDSATQTTVEITDGTFSVERILYR